MEPVQRYAVSLPGPVGQHGPATVVVVHWTPRTNGGHCVYADDTGAFEVVIDTDSGVASLLDAVEGHQHQCLHAVPLPQARAAASAVPPGREVWGGPIS
ncbi:DUF6296 family protein [Kitasatospora sp. NBC_01250]|uniref:DUF6296 family protein n=1 Tax=unclassified Kitasatospora TaxID=2633591 RepID=UPI002E14E56E|nr:MULTISPECIES: DUF6296 family protein [unclassified Kitasatospora]WSJ65686.1 DUF6296 family protein [Kitasatospora sp. NBC_01302]